MRYIIKKHNSKFYLVTEDERYLWGKNIKESVRFLSRDKANDVAKLLDFEVKIYKIKT